MNGVLGFSRYYPALHFEWNDDWSRERADYDDAPVLLSWSIEIEWC